MPAGLPLLETKFLAAALRPGLVVRQRLLDELDRLRPAALTLVDAPVGFGKTLLVRSWCDRTDSAIAWVSLDAGDDDPVRLWTYVASSVDRVRPGLGRPALARLRSVGVPADVAVDELLNAIAAYGEPLAIVLDDLHLVTSEACMRTVRHAVDHLPPNARIIATTRADPPLLLGRLRARGALGEIRSAELAFTREEARALLVDGEGIALGDGDVALLVERTEGWPAGLYLAALWLRELDDPGAVVAAFHGDHRHVADYLTGEVLDRLDPDDRRFLLETSAFHAFSGPLCDEVLGRSGSAARLGQLERENVFLIALDQRGEWYRYHHLFRDLLRLELASVDPSAAARLLVRASAWCREHGRIEAALEYAARAGEPALVGEILSAEHRTLLRSGRLATLLRFSMPLPDELLVESPEVPLAAALAAGALARPAYVRHRLIALAETARSQRPERWTPYHEVSLGIARGAWVEGDLGEAIETLRRALAVGREVPELAVIALTTLAFLVHLAGDDAEARLLAREALDRPDALGRPHGQVLGLATLSLIESHAGRPETGEELAREALATARRAGIDETVVGGDARTALASALAGLGKLPAAEREAVRGERLRRQRDPEALHLHALLVLAGIRARRGRLDRAAAELERVQAGLATIADTGLLPGLAEAVGQSLERARAGTPSEPPSAAELAVLPLLATELSLREIAGRLYLSLNTVKSHTRALYHKLGVSSREAAVVRATALGLLEPDDSPG